MKQVVTMTLILIGLLAIGFFILSTRDKTLDIANNAPDLIGGLT